ncbi:DMT family transporter [Phytoactinopolyspora halotolerans]|uniref:EamA family transporter n=1 Tax=Phytoactinopolyspora halotolerans TaxID=1981512 RepID=A0A6L9S5U8_9ACTN|nr:EamA family transporter [Phytoactinopolyspora halotolerans]NEE00024.1 EamA family transporter [Phytoactinopolyspora halotolerans]
MEGISECGAGGSAGADGRAAGYRATPAAGYGTAPAAGYGTAPAAQERGGLPAVVAAGVLWGTGGVAGSALGDVADVGSTTVAGYRLAVGGVLIVGWMLLTGRLRTLRPGRRGVRRLLTVGLITAWYQNWYFAAIELSSVGLATLLTLGAAPIMVVVAESVIAGRRPARRAIVAIAIATSGLALLVGVPGGDSSSSAVAGGLCALASAAGFAAITMLAARPVAGLTALSTVGIAFCAGGAITFALAALAGDVVIVVRAETIALVLYLGLVPTAIAYVSYFVGLHGVTAGTAVLMSLLEPLTAAVLGIVLLGERLGAFGVAGAVLIGTALMVASSPGTSGFNGP